VLTDALLMGNHRSRRVGQAIEFADYQEYAPGMDTRGLDWKVWARTDRLVVRRYETETELPCTVVLDLSGDLSTGESGASRLPDLDKSKAGYAISLAATLLYWFHRQGEPVGLHIVSGDGVTYRDLPARGGRNHLRQLFMVLAAARPAGRADLERALVEVGSRVRRRSWVGVITDGMEEPEQWLPSLGAFVRRGTDLRFVHMYDPDEMRMAFPRSALFFSPEGGEALAVDPVGAQEAFAEVVRAYLDEVRGGVIRFGGQYIQAATDKPMEELFHAIISGATAALVVP
jgi:uncharacterized protein (DUF58 family)